MTTVPRASLTEILSTSLSEDDLAGGLHKTTENTAFLSKFEDAWKDYLRQLPPNQLPRGEREANIESLLEKIKDVEQSKKTVEVELQQQLEFFQKSRQTSEDQFDAKLRDAMREQRSIHQELSQQLEIIDLSESLQKETFPWFHFLAEVNDLSSYIRQEMIQADEEPTSSQTVKPSARAVLLTKGSPKSSSDEKFYSGAFHTDHVLLETHIKMLKKEIERLEDMKLIQAHAGKFLMDLSAWEMLNENEDTAEMEESPKEAELGENWTV